MQLMKYIFILEAFFELPIHGITRASIESAGDSIEVLSKWWAWPP